MIKKTEVCAVIVSYNGADTIEATIRSIEPWVDRVFVVDNYSDVNTKELLQEISSEKINIIELEKNYGIAYALNIGFKWSIDYNYKWVFTLDQDSTFIKNSVELMYKAFSAELHEDNHIGILCPKIVYAKSNFEENMTFGINTNVNEKSLVITSGNLVNIKSYIKSGGFESKLFIDNVDFDFCFRLKLNGFRIIEVSSARLLHNLGSKEKVNLFNREINIVVHSNLRKYYMARNHVYLVKKYILAFPIEILKLNLFFILFLFQVFVLESYRIQSLKTIFNGMIDGILNRFIEHENQ